MSYRGIKNGSVQSGYFDNFLEGYPGQIATQRDPRLVDGYPAEVDLFVGVGVAQGTEIEIAAGKFGDVKAPFGVKAVDATTTADTFVGITVRDSALANDANGNPIYPAEAMASVLRKGRIYVEANQNIAAGDPVFLIIQDTATHGFQIGGFSNVALGGGTDTVELTNSSFWKNAKAGEVAVIELDV